MKAPLKQTVGIDVAKQELVVSLAKMNQELNIEIFAYKTFGNNTKGFEALVGWVVKRTDHQVNVYYVMEATGVYHEPLAYYLSDHGFLVSIVLPNKISNYSRTLDIKTVTDKTASKAIARFGLVNKLEIWQQPKTIFRNLRQLTRERDQIVAERTLLKNQLHAELTEAYPNGRSINRVNTRISLLNNQEAEIKSEIAELIKQDKELVKQTDIITSIPGVGKLTAIIV
ncbi:MAG: IS110 family transposase, partial [Pedobacter sp.]